MIFNDEKLIQIFKKPATEIEGSLARVLMIQREISRDLVKKLKALGVVARRIVSDRGCVCNKPRHRCGTNQMLDDINYYVKPDSSDKGIIK